MLKLCLTQKSPSKPKGPPPFSALATPVRALCLRIYPPSNHTHTLGLPGPWGWKEDLEEIPPYLMGGNQELDAFPTQGLNFTQF